MYEDGRVYKVTRPNGKSAFYIACENMLWNVAEVGVVNEETAVAYGYVIENCVVLTDAEYKDVVDKAHNEVIAELQTPEFRRNVVSEVMSRLFPEG